MDCDKTFVKRLRLDNTSSRSFKAQFWSFDLIFSVVIFSFAITILAYTWFTINTQLSNAYSPTYIILQMQEQALSQSIMSPGAPVNWQSAVNTLSTASWSGVSIGLAGSPSNSSISMNKLYALISMANYNYQALKPSLGVAFDYYITIVNSPSAANTVSISLGRSPFTNGALALFSQKMSATLNGIPVIVTVYVWTNAGFAIG